MTILNEKSIILNDSLINDKLISLKKTLLRSKMIINYLKIEG